MSSSSTAANITQPSDGGTPRGALDENLCERARVELDALRTTLDMRLAALEAGIANPDQAESLETLVLDLARAATVETEAAVLRACLEIQLEARAQVTEIEASVQAASRQEPASDSAVQAVVEETKSMLEEEQAAGITLRSALETAERRITALGREREAEILALRAEFAGQLSHDRANVITLRQSVAETQAALEAERAVGAGLKTALAQAEQQAVALEEKMQAEIRVLDRQYAAQLGVELETVAALHHTTAQMRATLDGEQAVIRELRGSLEQAVHTAAALDRKLADAERDLIEAEKRTQIAVRDRDLLIGELEATRQAATAARIEAQARVEAMATVPPPPAPSPYPVSRQAVRYAFQDEVSVEIDGSQCRVLDLSVIGSQVLSSTSLRPNRVVKFVLPLRTPVVCKGKVVWARLEVGPGKTTPCYRAGLSFPGEYEPAIKEFLTHRSPAEPAN